MDDVLNLLKETLQITGFVLVMMLVVEYLNVKTEGTLQSRLLRNRWGQYLIASLLGALPGCLGAFAVVALYTHRIVSLGALVAAMVATAGDESFVMFAIIPKQALFLHIALFAIGIVSGVVTDSVADRRAIDPLAHCPDMVVHPSVTHKLEPRSKGQLVRQWRECSVSRGIMFTALMILLVGALIGEIGPSEWDWIRVTILAVTSVAILIVATVSDHFLEEHLWNHVVLRHVPRIFLWTLGALIVLHFLVFRLDASEVLHHERWAILILAGIVGLIPESGPHLVFVTMYAKGLIPISILLASSIVQDGHGMLPLLAQSRRAFFIVKGINLGIGLLIGSIGLLLGY